MGGCFLLLHSRRNDAVVHLDQTRSAGPVNLDQPQLLKVTQRTADRLTITVAKLVRDRARLEAPPLILAHVLIDEQQDGLAGRGANSLGRALGLGWDLQPLYVAPTCSSDVCSALLPWNVVEVEFLLLHD